MFLHTDGDLHLAAAFHQGAVGFGVDLVGLLVKEPVQIAHHHIRCAVQDFQHRIGLAPGQPDGALSRFRAGEQDFFGLGDLAIGGHQVVGSGRKLPERKAAVRIGEDFVQLLIAPRQGDQDLSRRLGVGFIVPDH